AIVSRSGGNQGIGFAIPTNLAQYVMESIVQDGKVTRGYMGVLIQDVTPALAKQFKLPDASGALVGDVTPKGPADRGGIESGDVVLEFNGKPVRDSRQLKLQVAQTRPGTEVPVRLRRDGENQTIEITLQELPGSEDLAGAESGSPEDTGTLNGVAVGNLDSRTRQQVQAPASLRGAVVTEVEPNSAAAEAGLRPGDVILEINRQPVKSAEDAVRLTSKAEDRTSLLRVWRDGNRRYVVVDESQAG
ncbi:MAG: PDZ domain-containing protein, partial [Limisphaerales bacterium]